MVPDKPAFPPQENNPRINQQHMLPSAVPQRILGQIITGNPESLVAGSGNQISATIPNGQSGTFTTILRDIFNRVILAVPDESIFIGSSISAATQWPNVTHNMTNVQISFWNDWGLTDNVNVVHKASIFNNSGLSISIIYVIRWRIVTNPVAGNTGTNR